jgi:hypothetical protein
MKKMSYRFVVAKLHSPSATLRFGIVGARSLLTVRCSALFELVQDS